MNYLEKKKEKEIIKVKESRRILKNQELIENIINLIISKSNEDIKIEHYNKEIKQEKNISSELLIQKNSLFNFLFINKNLKEEMVVSFSLTFEKGSKEIDYKFYKKRDKDKFSENTITKINRTRMKFFNYIMDVIEEVIFSENKKIKKYVKAFYQEIKSSSFLFEINSLIRKRELKEKEIFIKLFSKNITYKELKEKLKKEKDFTLYYPTIIEKSSEKKEIMFMERTINKDLIDNLKNRNSRNASLSLRNLLTNVLIVDNEIINKEQIEKLEFMKYLDKKYRTIFTIREEMNLYLNKYLIDKF